MSIQLMLCGKCDLYNAKDSKCMVCWRIARKDMACPLGRTEYAQGMQRELTKDSKGE